MVLLRSLIGLYAAAMRFKGRVMHWLCRRFPELTGALSYFGIRVYFPRGSYSSRVLRSEGGFESANVRLLECLVRADSWVIDVGTNIGLMSIPVLASVQSSRVLSFEPSPNVLPYLRRTMAESRFADRWILVPKAAGNSNGRVTFSLSNPENCEFDGMRPTGRVPNRTSAEVDLVEIDGEWSRLGSPPVSVIKCDVEGAELEALRGARECILACHPYVLMEWNRLNYSVYGVGPGELLEFADQLDFSIYTVPNFVRICSLQELKLHMIETETFLLAPNREPIVAAALGDG